MRQVVATGSVAVCILLFVALKDESSRLAETPAGLMTLFRMPSPGPIPPSASTLYCASDDSHHNVGARRM